MVLGIDASRCGVSCGTGVEAYSRHIVRAILKELSSVAHPKFDSVFLYAQREISRDVLGGDYLFVTRRTIPLPRLWTHVRLSLEMLHEEPDVLFVPSHVLPLYHPQRSVVTIHDVAFMEFPEAYSFFQRKYLWFSTWLAVKEAVALIVPSETVKGDLMKHFSCDARKIHVVPHGFEMEKFDVSQSGQARILEQFGLTTDSKYILYVGRLEEKKNLTRLVSAFLKFHGAHRDWKLILAGGRGFGFGKIFSEVEHAGAWGSILMPGYVSDVERDVLYRHCQFAAFVSLAEGFGFPVLEAANFGKQVLASDIPVLHEIGGDALTYTDPLDVSDISRGMLELAKSSGDERVAMRMRKICDRYSWKGAADETLRVLEKSVLQSPHG
jgi:glycosyltransferase involved in cell wall biosynthesis